MIFNAAFMVILAALALQVRNRHQIHSRAYDYLDATAQALACTSLVMSGAIVYFWTHP